MSNQTLIQIPMGGELGDPARLRIFLLRLIEKLDIILGYRGGDSYVTQSELASADNDILAEINLTDLTLGNLAQIIQQVATQVGTNSEAISENTEAISAIQQETLIAKLGFSTVTASVAYDQTEAQAVANQAKAAGDKIDELFDILVLTGIITL